MGGLIPQPEQIVLIPVTYFKKIKKKLKNKKSLPKPREGPLQKIKREKK